MHFVFHLFLVYGIYSILLKMNLNLNNISSSFYKASIYTITFGSIMKGILEIFSTTNDKIIFYWIAGGVLFIMAIYTGFKIKSNK